MVLALLALSGQHSTLAGRSAEAYCRPRIPGAPAETPSVSRVDLLSRPAGIAADGGRDTAHISPLCGSPARSLESPSVAPPTAAAPRTGAPPTHHSATHAYISVIYARSARSRGHAPARPVPGRDDRQLHAKHTCCQRPRPSSFPRTIGRVSGEEDLIQAGDVGHIWVAEQYVGI